MGESYEIITSLLPAADLSLSQVAILDSVEASHAAALVRYLYREYKNSPHAREALPEFLKIVEGSERALVDWVREIIEVYTWLWVQKYSARFRDVVEYVSCAYEGSSAQIGHSISWYLDNYGFEKRFER